MRMTDETKEHINICRMQDCRLRAVCKTPILHTARSTQADGDDIKMHADWCKKFVKGINWQGGSGRCPLCRRIHADLTPLQNLHAHAHCRLDTIADLTLGAMSIAHGQCNSVPRCTGHWSYDEGQDVPRDLGRLFPKQANALLVSALYSG